MNNGDKSVTFPSYCNPVNSCLNSELILVCPCFQAGWGGGRSLPAGIALRWDWSGTSSGEGFGLRLPPSPAQCSGQTGAYTCCVVTAVSQPPGCHRHATEPAHRGEGTAATVASCIQCFHSAFKVQQTHIETVITTKETKCNTVHHKPHPP